MTGNRRKATHHQRSDQRIQSPLTLENYDKERVQVFLDDKDRELRELTKMIKDDLSQGIASCKFFRAEPS